LRFFSTSSSLLLSGSSLSLLTETYLCFFALYFSIFFLATLSCFCFSFLFFSRSNLLIILCSFSAAFASRFSFKFSKRLCLAFSNAAIWALVRGFFFLRVFWMVSSATSGAASSGMILFWLVSSILHNASIIICGRKRSGGTDLLKDLEILSA